MKPPSVNNAFTLPLTAGVPTAALPTWVDESKERTITVICTGFLELFDILFSHDRTPNIPDPVGSLTPFSAQSFTYLLRPINTHFKVVASANSTLRYWFGGDDTDLVAPTVNNSTMLTVGTTPVGIALPLGATPSANRTLNFICGQPCDVIFADDGLLASIPDPVSTVAMFPARRVITFDLKPANRAIKVVTSAAAGCPFKYWLQ